MKNWIVNNFWIKIISLILAVITWSYINGELDKESRISRDFYSASLKEQSEKNSSPGQRPMNRGYITEKK